MHCTCSVSRGGVIDELCDECMDPYRTRARSLGGFRDGDELRVVYSVTDATVEARIDDAMGRPAWVDVEMAYTRVWLAGIIEDIRKRCLSKIPINWAEPRFQIESLAKRVMDTRYRRAAPEERASGRFNNLLLEDEGRFDKGD